MILMLKFLLWIRPINWLFMLSKKMLKNIIISLMIFCLFSSYTLSDECYWPNFRGPNRDNLSEDTDLLKKWPPKGPELIWKTTGIGYGFSTVSIVEGMIYTAGNIQDFTNITAMDMSGKMLWQFESGPAFTKSYPGSRGTPTIYDGKLYHLNGNGYIICLDAKTGEEIWSFNIIEKFNGRLPEWGLSESLMVYDDKVVCCPGGEEISIVALNRHTGETIWTCRGIGDKPAYASPIIVDYEGLRQIVTVMSGSAVGVNAETGELLWRHIHPVKYDSNISTPIYHDGHIFLFQTFGNGTKKLKLNVKDDTCFVELIWQTGELDNEHGGVVLVDSYLYGHADGNHKWRHWACLDAETGETMYSVDGLPAKASGTLTYADGMLYLLGQPGNVALMPASPDGFNIVSKFQLPEDSKGTAWAYPVVCGGRLYIRHGEFLYAYKITF
ncbi:PQQ-binding-like beta-propeller repeat protein [Candidatus Poribacteria bacterium]|nr:PQQ-binding-like beta-propeller repeat protein [Candidatus Poribacteria bacterium]